MSQRIRSVLVANRAEIAARVIRTCRRLGLKTVAVYSEADRDAQHVKRAGEAYLLGPGPATESYLNVDKIMEVIEASGAEAVIGVSMYPGRIALERIPRGPSSRLATRDSARTPHLLIV